MKKRGRGIACMYYPNGSTGKPNPSACHIKINNDGTVVGYVGAVDEGQGSTTIMRQMIAEKIGVEYDKVRMVTADTELTPFDFGTGASRVTYILGNAVERAAENAARMLREAAAQKLRVVDPDKLEAAGGKIWMRGFPDSSITVAQAAWASEVEFGRPIMGTASFTPAATDLDPQTGHGKAFEVHIFATQIAEVEVDTETGEVDVLRIVAVHDCGTAINPMFVEGQIEGGVSMGIGYALCEEIKEDPSNGALRSRSFTDYKIATIRDMPPELVVDLVEIEERLGPFGAKGVGEPTNLPTAPAIINAIYDAVGVRIHDLPATPEKILAALSKGGQV